VTREGYEKVNGLVIVRPGGETFVSRRCLDDISENSRRMYRKCRVLKME